MAEGSWIHAVSSTRSDQPHQRATDNSSQLILRTYDPEALNSLEHQGLRAPRIGVPAEKYYYERCDEKSISYDRDGKHQRYLP